MAGYKRDCFELKWQLKALEMKVGVLERVGKGKERVIEVLRETLRTAALVRFKPLRLHALFLDIDF